MNISYIIPYRSDNEGYRETNLKIVLEWLSNFDDLEIILVEQDAISRLDQRILPLDSKHVFVFNQGIFNKAWALNVGFKEANGDVIAIGDSDITIDPKALANAFSTCLQRFDAVNPYSDLIDLSAEASKGILLSDYKRDKLAPMMLDKNRKKVKEHLCFSGGIVLFKSVFYEMLGGFDERFEGWGAEDDAMDIKIRAATARITTVKNQVAYHLWHPKNPEKKNNFYYNKNCQILHAYHQMGRDDVITLCHTHRATMGDKDRIKALSKAENYSAIY